MTLAPWNPQRLVRSGQHSAMLPPGHRLDPFTQAMEPLIQRKLAGPSTPGGTPGMMNNMSWQQLRSYAPHDHALHVAQRFFSALQQPHTALVGSEHKRIGQVSRAVRRLGTALVVDEPNALAARWLALQARLAYPRHTAEQKPRHPLAAAISRMGECFSIAASDYHAGRPEDAAHLMFAGYLHLDVIRTMYRQPDGIKVALPRLAIADSTFRYLSTFLITPPERVDGIDAAWQWATASVQGKTAMQGYYESFQQVFERCCALLKQHEHCRQYRKRYESALSDAVRAFERAGKTFAQQPHLSEQWRDMAFCYYDEARYLEASNQRRQADVGRATGVETLFNNTMTVLRARCQAKQRAQTDFISAYERQYRCLRLTWDELISSALPFHEARRTRRMKITSIALTSHRDYERALRDRTLEATGLELFAARSFSMELALDRMAEGELRNGSLMEHLDRSRCYQQAILWHLAGSDAKATQWRELAEAFDRHTFLSWRHSSQEHAGLIQDFMQA